MGIITVTVLVNHHSHIAAYTIHDHRGSKRDCAFAPPFVVFVSPDFTSIFKDSWNKSYCSSFFGSFRIF